MFSLDRINSDGVGIEASLLARLVDEKLLSLCQHCPSYTKIHPRRGEQGNSYRAKDMFDISSILKADHQTRARMLSNEEIEHLRLLMGDIDLTAGDLAALAGDISNHGDEYATEYDMMNRDLVLTEERIAFTTAKKDVLDTLQAVCDKL
ncbi:hypothetical protein GA0061078_1593 [Bifidobacterium bohemicum]|uniref:Uncharacterized protein n=1 Tax=Bifidobacterium bohemicum DSM 22767 TaxID=1437606 RepID=A0A086ZHF9_9BIFI|nr:hypothetical protein [Bifidobacterium bohemicum]KFI45959.1 hypothetical protein BBOH_0766 [Bifidobacterium bohemicum DSM 22767]SCC14082.1 hypothetical protein GA0061078_1593 [Bifidobacterium bohemicum]